ncbi:ABC transporter permease [Bacillus sp. JJ353]|uniref:ABC transporter permease n=1 Tax=Bacillus sp. JJ353 TaxID=3122967 RepID=UPI003394DE5B
MDVLQQLGMYYAHNGGYVLEECYRHFLMSAYGVLIAAIAGIPAGIFIARYQTLSGWIFTVTNVIQTIPALAMLAVLMLVLGLGANTVIVSLFLYSLLPIIRNTYTGIKSIDHAYLEAAKAMGMTSLGDIIIRGSNATNGTAIILAGAIPTALMAVIADLLMSWLERTLSPLKGKH